MKKQFLLFTALVISLVAISQSYTHQQKIIAADGQREDFFGTSTDVSLDGKFLVAGAIYNDTSTAPNRGAAYVYKYDAATGSWNQQAKLVASDGLQGAWFGNAVCIDAYGNYIAVGAYNAKVDNKNGAGAVYIFKRTGSTWVQQAKIVDPVVEGSELFGSSIDFSADGRIIMISAQAKNNGTGRVFMFCQMGSVWSFLNSFSANDGNSFDWFGISLSLSANARVLAVGAYSKEINTNPLETSGAVYIFNRIENHVWVQVAKLYPSDVQKGMQFGWDVKLSASGRSVIVGLVNGVNDTNYIPGAYVFTKTSTGWAQQAKLVPAGTRWTCHLATSVALSASGDTAVLGEEFETLNTVHQTNSKGCAFVFTRSGNTWTEKQKIFNPAGQKYDNLGASLAITPNGKQIFAGAVQNKGLSFGGNGYVSYFNISTAKAVLNKGIAANIMETKPAFANAIHIFPNPAKDFIIISLDNKNISGFIKIEDRVGNVFINTAYIQNGEHINVSLLKQGIYYVSLMNENRRLYKSTFIKE